MTRHDATRQDATLTRRDDTRRHETTRRDTRRHETRRDETRREETSETRRYEARRDETRGGDCCAFAPTPAPWMLLSFTARRFRSVRKKSSHRSWELLSPIFSFQGEEEEGLCPSSHVNRAPNHTLAKWDNGAEMCHSSALRRGGVPKRPRRKSMAYVFCWLFPRSAVECRTASACSLMSDRRAGPLVGRAATRVLEESKHAAS